MELRIKEICNQKGIKISVLATNIGIAQESLSRLINSDNPNPKIDTLQRIAEGLGVTVPELFKLQPEKECNDLTCPKCGSHLEIQIKVN